MKKFINNATWFLLGVAATIFAIVIYAANNGGINTNGDNQEVYEDSAARVAIMAQIAAEEDTTISLSMYAQMIKRYFVSEMIKAGATDSINADAFVQEMIDEFLPVLDREYHQYLIQNFTQDEIMEMVEINTRPWQKKSIECFGQLHDRILEIAQDPETFETVKRICKKYGY